MQQNPNFVLARQLWDGIALGDAPILRSVLAEDCVWTMYGRNPLAGIYEGVDAILNFMATVGDLTEEMKSELIDVFVGEEGGVLRYAIHATRGGQELDTHQFFQFRTRAGRIVEAELVTLDAFAYDRFFLPN